MIIRPHIFLRQWHLTCSSSEQILQTLQERFGKIQFPFVRGEQSIGDMRPIRILLSDDKAMVRQAIRVLLETEPDFLVVGEASDAMDTLDLVRKFSPRVALLDLAMPGLNGFELLRDIHRYSPPTRLLVLSSGYGKQSVMDALKRNVAGFVFKSANYVTLASAIRIVADGGKYIPVTLSKSDMENGTKRKHERFQGTGETLTLRQHEVLQLVARGFTNREIGFRLSISPRTVEVHRAKLMQKLALRDRADLIRFAFRSTPFAANELAAASATLE